MGDESLNMDRLWKAVQYVKNHGPWEVIPLHEARRRAGMWWAVTPNDGSKGDGES